MASVASTSSALFTTLSRTTPEVKCTIRQGNRLSTNCGLKLVPKIQISKAAERSSSLGPCFNINTISCSLAQPETLQIVQSTIAKQLSIEESTVTPQTKFADSLDIVEIMMALEERFGVSIGESGAENISTVQDAADLIEKLKASEA